MTTKKLVNEMMQNIVHIGNKASFWNPKMREFIYGSSSWVHVFDLDKTAQKLEEAKKAVAEMSAEGKTVLFVSTKIQARKTISTIAEETGHAFVADKWVPGLLTNFKTIKKRIATYQKLKKDAENGAFDVLTKKEKAAKLLELSKLDTAYRGLVNMRRTPDAIFVVDGKFEGQAIKEAKKMKTKIFGIANTNADPDILDYIVPANTNSFKSIKFIMDYIKADMPARKVQERTATNKGARKMTQRDSKKAPVAKKEEK